MLLAVRPKTAQKECPLCRMPFRASDIRNHFGLPSSVLQGDGVSPFSNRTQELLLANEELRSTVDSLSRQLLKANEQLRHLSSTNLELKLQQSVRTPADYRSQLLKANPPMPTSSSRPRFPSREEIPLQAGRLIEVCPSLGLVFVACASLGAFGYLKLQISAPTHLKHAQRFFELHRSEIRDMKVSPCSKHLLTVSLDHTAVVTLINSDQTQIKFPLPGKGWSCAWDLYCSNLAYVGLHDGSVVRFDLRQPSVAPLSIYACQQRGPPIFRLTALPHPDARSTLLAATFQGLSVITDMKTSQPLGHLCSGNCVALSHHERSSVLVSTYMNSVGGRRKHVYFQLDLTAGYRVDIKKITQGESRGGGRMTSRTSLASDLSSNNTNELSNLRLLECHDEPTSSVVMWNVGTEQIAHSFDHLKGSVMDCTMVHTASDQLVLIVSSESFYLFNLQE